MDYHKSLECPNVKGKTIGEVFESGKVFGIDLEKLDDLMMSKEFKTINHNGIRFKNTMALLKQILKYAKDNGFTKNNFDFQVKRLSAKNDFNIKMFKN